MKATLDFDLDNREDQLAHLRCIKSLDMALALWEIDQYLAGMGKRTDMPLGEELRQRIYAILDKYKIKPDELSE